MNNENEIVDDVSDLADTEALAKANALAKTAAYATAGDETASEDPAEISKKGYQLLKENHISKAIDCFAKILSIEENNNYALVGLGDATRKRGSYEQAIGFYKRCLEHHPGNNYALFGLGDCYRSLNQFAKAVEVWEQYLLRDERNITVLTRIADAYRKMHNFRQSKEVYLRVMEMEKDNPYAIIGLGHLHYDFKEYRDALFYLEKMLVLGGEKVDIRVLTSIGNCHRKLKNFADGVPHFERALDREPDNFYALFGLADCYRGMNKQERSLEYWNRILDKDARNKVILTRSGDAYRNMGNYDKAQEYYERALDIEFDPYAVLGLALISKAREKYDVAVASLQRLLQQDPHNYRVFVELYSCYLKNGDTRKAKEALQEIQRLGLYNSQINELIGKLDIT